MVASLPYSVQDAQPFSVLSVDYRIRVASGIKKGLARRVIDLVRLRLGDPTLDRAKCETALRNLGVKAGNAQRILDDTSDVRVGTLADVAARLGVHAAALLSDGVHEPPTGAAGQSWPLERIPADQWAELTERERGAIEEAAVSKLKELLAEKRQRAINEQTGYDSGGRSGKPRERAA